MRCEKSSDCYDINVVGDLPPFRERAMKPSLDPADREFLERLHRLRSGTIQEICAQLGVTATAVRQRLNRLQGQGLVTRETVRSGRGRPHHTYGVTAGGRRELGENYADLARLLWQAIQRVPNADLKAEVLAGVRDAFVANYGAAVRGETLPERIGSLCRSLEEKGCDVELDTRSGLPILRENNCPYLELAESDPSICELEQQVFREILGAPVTLTQCCLDGHSCCEFQPDALGEEAGFARNREESNVREMVASTG
jgi:predicted ArsR family transcriptional regulator